MTWKENKECAEHYLKCINGQGFRLYISERYSFKYVEDEKHEIIFSCRTWQELKDCLVGLNHVLAKGKRDKE